MIQRSQVTEFAKKCQALCDDHYAENFPHLYFPLIEIQFATRYAKLIKDVGGNRGVYCFVDMTNGDILKASSWKAPAKGARGNLNDTYQGMARMTPYGTEYNRG